MKKNNPFFSSSPQETYFRDDHTPRREVLITEESNLGKAVNRSDERNPSAKTLWRDIDVQDQQQFYHIHPDLIGEIHDPRDTLKNHRIQSS